MSKTSPEGPDAGEMGLTFSADPPAPQAYLDLFETTGWNMEYRATAEELDRANRSSWRLIAAYDGKRLVGFGRVVSDAVLHATIYDMIVRPEYQGRGLGSRILSQLLESCRQARIRDVQLFCAAGKAAFYQRHGFETRPADAPGMQLRSGPAVQSRGASERIDPPEGNE